MLMRSVEEGSWLVPACLECHVNLSAAARRPWRKLLMRLQREDAVALEVVVAAGSVEAALAAAGLERLLLRLLRSKNQMPTLEVTETLWLWMLGLLW